MNIFGELGIIEMVGEYILNLKIIRKKMENNLYAMQNYRSLSIITGFLALALLSLPIILLIIFMPGTFKQQLKIFSKQTIPTKIPTLRGTKPGMNFQEFSKAMKGSYKGQGYARGQQLKIKWHDYKQNELHLELNTSAPRQTMEYVIQLTGEVINQQNKK